MTLNDATIFFVDDDPSVRRALSSMFKSLGYQVQAFPSAKGILAAEIDAYPACIVLDVRMPGMDGIELREKLADSGSDIPIVFITAHGEIDMAVQAMKDGAVDFLPKPFEAQDLIDSVERALELHCDTRGASDELEVLKTRLERLSPREKEVFELVVQGLRNKEIGWDLGTVEQTVKVHRSRVMKKMEAETLADLVRMAERLGVEGPG